MPLAHEGLRAELMEPPLLRHLFEGDCLSRGRGTKVKSELSAPFGTWKKTFVALKRVTVPWTLSHPLHHSGYSPSQYENGSRYTMSTAIDSPRSILSTHPGSFDAPSIRTADDWFSLRDAPPFNPSPPSHRSGNSGETQPVAAELENHDGELEQLEVQELDSKKRKGGFEEKTHAWDTILKRYMAGIGIGPIDEESPGTDGTPSMRTMWIESPCHSRRPSETFTRSEIDAVNETVVDRSDFGDDNTKANKPGTVDSPTIKDQYQSGSSERGHRVIHPCGSWVQHRWVREPCSRVHRWFRVLIRPDRSSHCRSLRAHWAKRGSLELNVRFEGVPEQHAARRRPQRAESGENTFPSLNGVGSSEEMHVISCELAHRSTATASIPGKLLLIKIVWRCVRIHQRSQRSPRIKSRGRQPRHPC